MKYRPHYNGWRTDHIKTRDTGDLVEAYNSREEGCLVQSMGYDQKVPKRQLMSWVKNINLKFRLHGKYDRGRVSFLTKRQVDKYNNRKIPK